MYINIRFISTERNKLFYKSRSVAPHDKTNGRKGVAKRSDTGRYQ